MNYYTISQRRNEGTLQTGSDPENNVKGSRSQVIKLRFNGLRSHIQIVVQPMNVPATTTNKKRLVLHLDILNYC